MANDNLVNRRIAAQFARRLGYEVDAVSSGREALAAVKTKKYNVVLMDCHMPDMDGFEATAAIRQLGNGAGDKPIAAVTASALKGDRERCLAAGMNEYLSKPFQPEELRSLLRKYASEPAVASPDD